MLFLTRCKYYLENNELLLDIRAGRVEMLIDNRRTIKLRPAGPVIIESPSPSFSSLLSSPPLSSSPSSRPSHPSRRLPPSVLSSRPPPPSLLSPLSSPSSLLTLPYTSLILCLCFLLTKSSNIDNKTKNYKHLDTKILR